LHQNKAKLAPSDAFLRPVNRVAQKLVNQANQLIAIEGL
jgi:hypothetical protein